MYVQSPDKCRIVNSLEGLHCSTHYTYLLKILGDHKLEYLMCHNLGLHLTQAHNLLHYRQETIRKGGFHTLDPSVSGVFSGPYPFGIDPVSA